MAFFTDLYIDLDFDVLIGYSTTPIPSTGIFLKSKGKRIVKSTSSTVKTCLYATVNSLATSGSHKSTAQWSSSAAHQLSADLLSKRLRNAEINFTALTESEDRIPSQNQYTINAGHHLSCKEQTPGSSV